MSETSDEELMRAVRDGDVAQLGVLFERHHARVHALCFRLTRRADVADDLAQETMLRVLRYASSFRRDSAFTTWLYRLAFNVCRDHWRKTRRDEQTTDLSEVGDVTARDGDDPIDERMHSSSRPCSDSRRSVARYSSSVATTISDTTTSRACSRVRRPPRASARIARSTSFGRFTVNWNDDSAACANAREAIADAVLVRGGADIDPAIERHIASCAECRAYRSDCETLWLGLGELPVPAPAADARRQFDEALGRRPPSRWPSWKQIAIAAGLVVAALIGYGAGALRERQSPLRAASAATDSTPRFLLLLYDSGDPAATPSAERRVKIVAEYSAWARSLAAEGRLVSAEELSDAPPEWLGGSVRTVDGAYIGGFFLIRARDLSEARHIAERCPHLKYGGRIELRPIHPT